jgi:hypothetical protein
VATRPLLGQTPAIFTGVERVVAIGDVHGDYDAFATVLQQAELIDKKGRWTGGKTHLVQCGDVPDRGKDTKKIMDLLMSLEKDAAKAGGGVHPLIGNHEAMTIYGDLRYTTPGEFAAFRNGDSERVRSSMWDQEVSTGRVKADDASRKKWEEEHPLGWFEQRVAFSARGTYGKWIRSHPAVIKINDSIYLHGGISPRFAAIPLQKIDEMVASELNDFSKLKDGSAVTSPDGPLWYRGLAQDNGEEFEKLVDQVLATQGAKHIVIAHTPTPGVVMPRLNGKVIMIDVGLSTYFGSERAFLVEEHNELFAVHRGIRMPLPTTGGMALLEYFKKALALQPPGTPLAKYVAQQEVALRSEK